MPNIESMSVLRQTDQLDKISQSQTPMFVTKNGRAYLVIMSSESYEEIIKDLDYYKQAFDREREMMDLVAKVERSHRNIAEGKSFSEDEFDRMMGKLLS